MPLRTNPDKILPSNLDHEAFNKTEEFAACFCGLSVETIRGFRKRSVGPRFRKIMGKSIRYSVASLVEFMESQPTGGEGDAGTETETGAEATPARHVTQRGMGK